MDTNETLAGKANTRSKPKLLCVGTGRDGTLSLNHMIRCLFASTDGRRTMHEYRNREFYQAFSEYKETGSLSRVDDMRRMIDECPYDCIVGNGYAAILPLFREQWGAETRLVHIKRANRAACISSLLKNCEIFPFAYRYYSSAEAATVKRMAAFHFNEMSKDAWDKLPTTAKFAWYYDKTHALIDQHKGLFAQCIELCTETLSEEHTRRTIARMIGEPEATLPPPTHLNARTLDIAAVPEEQRDRATWLLGQLNLSQLLNDDVYGIDYFLDKFVAWTGYQIRGQREHLARAKCPSREESAETIARARSVLNKAMEQIDGLDKLNLERGE
jgi:hypothetical protein